MRTIVLVLVLIAVLLVGGLMAASELGGEVVTLTTVDADGRSYETSLWIVEDEDDLWLRAGMASNAWYHRLQRNPHVTLRWKDGREVKYEAVPMPDRTARINKRMAEDYGVADRMISLMRDSDESVAIRLDPVPFQ